MKKGVIFIGKHSLITLLFLYIVSSCASVPYNYFVPSKAMLPKDKSSLQTIGISCTSASNAIFEINIPSGSNTPGQQYYSLGHALALSIGSGIAAGLEEAAIEEKEAKKLNELLSGWDIHGIFKETFYNQLSEMTSFQVIEIEEPLFKKDILGAKGAALRRKMNAVILTRLTDFGMELKEKGFTVYLRGVIEIVDLRTKRTLGSQSVVYNYDYGLTMQDECYARYIDEQINTGKILKKNYIYDAGKQRIDYDYYKNDFPPDSVCQYPLNIDNYVNFISDDEQLLKQELERGVMEIVRGLIFCLGLSKEDEKRWRDEYRL